MAFWNRITALIAGGAVATAASDGVRPVLEPVRQHAWEQNKLRVLAPTAAAELRAQGLIDDAAAYQEGGREGFNENRIDALVQMLQSAPGRAELERMLNRDKIDRADFNHGLAKHKVEPRYWEALYDLTHEKLDPVQLANAIHRGLIDDPGLLAVPPPTGTGNVPAYPVYPIDALAEAKTSGLDRSRLGVLVGLMGLPMGVHEAAQAVFRKIITKTDYSRAVAEGNTRNEWQEALFEQSRQIPTARDFLENALRGYRTLADAITGAELHGMTPEHATLIYQNQGRPMNVRQITQALARGGRFKPEPGEITNPYDAAIVEGSIKPAYYDLTKALRYTLPSVFAIRGLAQSGVWGEAKVKERLLWWGWIPEDAADVAKAWTGASGTSADSHEGKAETQLWGTLHRSYVAEESDDATATATLTALGVDAAVQPRVLALWNQERDLIRKQLTPAQIKKAWVKNVLNPSTGAAWTRDEALAGLIARGYSPADANTFLEI